MASSHSSHRHDGGIGGRCFCPWMGLNLWRPSYHHNGSRGSVQHCYLVSAHGDMGDQKQHHNSLSSGSERIGRALPSSTKGGSSGPWRRCRSSMVLASSSCAPRHQDDHQTGCWSNPIRFGLRRGGCSPWLLTFINSFHRRGTSATETPDHRQSQDGSRTPSADPDVYTSSAESATSNRPSHSLSRLHQERWHHNNPLNTLHWSLQSRRETAYILQSQHPWQRCGISGSRPHQTSLRCSTR